MSENGGITKLGSRSFLPWWRRTYLVNRDLQLKYATSAMVIGLVSTLVSAGMVLWTFYSFNIWQGQRLPPPVVAVVGAVLLVNFFALFIVAVVATHKVVGPMFNLLRQFQRLAHADFSAVARFRSSDEMHYVARRFNEMTMMLKVRNDYIFGQIEEALKSIESGDSGNARRSLVALREMREREGQERARDLAGS
jgi:methyl-accepting chemotaxis protein